MPPHEFDLLASASAEMVHAGFAPDPPEGVGAQVAEIRIRLSQPHAADLCDKRDLSWSSIDNDTSRDLDQIEVAERIEAGIRISVGVADVASAVLKDTAIDRHASEQTQTVYTAVRNFPMLPVELSTDLTSLNEGQDRQAIVVDFTVGMDGTVQQQEIYEALVRNGAQLAYSKVGPWLSGQGSADAKVDSSAELQRQLRLQDEAARALHEERVRRGALEFNRAEADPVVVDGKVQALKTAEHNRATDLIEELMIATNETMAQALGSAHRSCLRRVVRSPERWLRIVELAARYGTTLPQAPDSGALNTFLQSRKAADPTRYADVSLAVIKLMGPGEYVLARGQDEAQVGHFGLAARDYAHTTAPNRRFADLVTQRVVKAMLHGDPPPYTDDELAAIATHCNERDSAARKVERAMQKRAAAVALSHSIGSTFQGVITGAGPKGVYVRVFDPPVEGKIVQGEQGLDVGDSVRVKLLHTDPERAFIDFGRSA